MKTTFSNTRHPELVKWVVVVSGVVGLACWVVYFLADGETGKTLLYIAAYTLFYFALFFGAYRMRYYVIDDEADTLMDSQNKKYPIVISKLSTATVKESRKGRFRGLVLHDTGVNFIDIHCSRATADRLMEHLLRLNPAIEVKHANYL